MKRAHLNISVNVKDDFVPGDCENCPFATRNEYEDRMQTYYGKAYCALGYGKVICPLEVYVYPDNDALIGKGKVGKTDEQVR